MLTAQFRKLINPLCLISIIFDYYSVYFTIPLIFCVCGWWLLCSPHGFSEINFLNFPFIFYIELWSFSAHNATNCALFDYFQLCINLFTFLYRSTLQYTSSQTPFLPTRNNLIQKSSVSAGGARSPHGFSEKNFKKCSWRCIAIFFVVLAVILSAALAYITGKFLISQFSIYFLQSYDFFYICHFLSPFINRRMWKITFNTLFRKTSLNYYVR